MHLKLLAEQVTPAIQLDAIFISHVKEKVALYGQSKSAKDISLMVKQLYLSPLLKGIALRQYVLARKRERIKFEVATKERVNQSRILKNAFLQGKLQRKLLLENQKYERTFILYLKKNVAELMYRINHIKLRERIGILCCLLLLPVLSWDLFIRQAQDKAIIQLEEKT